MPKPAPMAKSDPLDEVEESAASEMIAILTGENPDVGAFKAALKDFVVACIKRQGAGEYEEDE